MSGFIVSPQPFLSRLRSVLVQPLCQDFPRSGSRQASPTVPAVSGTGFALSHFQRANGPTDVNWPEKKERAQSSLRREPVQMYHTIEFADEHVFDLEVSPKHWLERLIVRKGARLQAQIKPYVVETEAGPVEVADLFLADGTTTRMVPFELLSFVD